MTYNTIRSRGATAYSSRFKEEIDSFNPQLPETAKIPSGLLELAPLVAWEKVQVDEIIENALPIQSCHVYLEEILVRRHHPNLVFEQVRHLLKEDQLFAFKIITAENIKYRLEGKLPPSILRVYYPAHFFFRRVLPKLKGFRKVCRLVHIPIDVSKAEILGRLIYKGFQIVSLQESKDETIVVAKKHPTLNPSSVKPEPSEGILFKMLRMGKNAKKITVYKFRSMHPYAEYVQEYMHTNHGLDAGGKFKNDFRVSTGGRVIRKYWIDELPMLYNLLKGDMKLIGVRPLTEHYFNLYPEQLKSIRIQTKPGLLPPFYADLPTTFEEIVQSELAYLEAYAKAPLQTDWNYFVRILKNIVIHKARSK